MRGKVLLRMWMVGVYWFFRVVFLVDLLYVDVVGFVYGVSLFFCCIWSNYLMKGLEHE